MRHLPLLLFVAACMLLVGCIPATHIPATQEPTPEEPNSLLATAKIAEMSGASLTLEDGVTMTFDKDLETAFAHSDALRDRLAAEGLQPKTEDTVEEYEDRVRIRKRTVVEMADEDAGLLEQHPDDVPPSDIPSNLTLIDDSTFIGGYVDSYLQDCRGEDLCGMSREELLALLEEKDGEYEIVETVDLNKIPIPLGGLALRLNQSNLREEPYAIDLAGLRPLRAANEDTLRPMRQEMLYLGPVSEEQRFLNGFTYGLDYSYSYEKTWKKRGVNVASIKVYAYLGYGFGLRIPLETKATLSKGVAFSDDPNLTAAIALRTLDLSAPDYRALGVPEQYIYDGKELVLQIGAVSGARIELLGQTIFSQEQGKVIDNSKDFRPPLGSERVNLGNLVFPGIETGLYYGADQYYVAANLGIGFDLAGTKVTMRCTGNATQGCPERITFTDEGEQRFAMRITPTEFPENDTYGSFGRYGIVLDDVAYHPRAVFDFKVALEGGLYTGKYLFKWVRVTTPWISVYSLGLDLPSLETHFGTPSGLAMDQNKVYLHATVHNATPLLPPINLTPQVQPTLKLNVTVAPANGSKTNTTNLSIVTLTNTSLHLVVPEGEEDEEDEPLIIAQPIVVQPVQVAQPNTTTNTSNLTLVRPKPFAPVVIRP